MLHAKNEKILLSPHTSCQTYGTFNKTEVAPASKPSRHSDLLPRQIFLQLPPRATKSTPVHVLRIRVEVSKFILEK